MSSELFLILACLTCTGQVKVIPIPDVCAQHDGICMRCSQTGQSEEVKAPLRAQKKLSWARPVGVGACWGRGRASPCSQPNYLCLFSELQMLFHS
jgi:hypothetical protein